MIYELRKFKFILFLIFFLSGFLVCQNVKAACTGSSPNWTASDNTVAEIQACINGATAGDTINVPEGAGSVEWTSYININKSVKIIGPGQNIDDTFKLKITWTGSYAFSTTASASNWRISGFLFDTATNQAAIDVNNGTEWRIDHNQYDNNMSENSGVFVITNIDTYGAALNGLVDNNIINHGRVLTNNQNVGLLIGGYIWNGALGLGSEDAVYVEDNNFTFTMATSAGNCMDSNRGAKYVFRYNTVTQTGIMAHSLQAAAERGTRKWEIYGNRFNSLSSNLTFAGAFQRGGTGMIFYNDFTSAVVYNHSVLFDNVRSASANIDNNTTGLGACDGDHGWDGNEDASGYPCRDQIGRSSDATLWTDGSSPGPAQTLTPVYLWSEYANGDATYAYVDTDGKNSDHIKADRDFYDYNISFNGTSGTGCGTLANRPSSCTVGVGYWATDQDNCSDLTGYVGDSTQRTSGINTYIQGTLYKCISANNWEEYYTPYTYPHPLRTEVTDIVAPASPTGLSVS